LTLPRDSRSATVLELRSRSTDRAPERALVAVHRQLRDARSAIDDCLAGDIDMVFTVDRMVIQAVRTTLANGLSTCRSGGPTCSVCGAEISAGRCWGCGAPPERAS